MVYVERLHVRTHKKAAGDNRSSLNEVNFERAVLGIQSVLKVRTENFITQFFVTQEKPEKGLVTCPEPDLVGINFPELFCQGVGLSRIGAEGVWPGNYSGLWSGTHR